MSRFIIPKKYFNDPDKQPVTIRIPKDLRLALQNISKDKGRTTSDIVVSVLDQFAAIELGLVKAPPKKD